MALRNLPAYVVSNVKVYEKSNPLARPGSMEERLDKTLVMDVNLKKQYQMGFVGSLEGGYGSNNRYLGRLFALEYTRQARIGAYANINNINNDSRGRECRSTMASSWTTDGRRPATTRGGASCSKPASTIMSTAPTMRASAT